MDEKFRAILESIPMRQRSKLEPYTELIEELRRRGHTYREISGILAEKCDLTAASSTLVRFVAARAKEKRKRPKLHERLRTVQASIDVNVTSAIPNNDVWNRIEALKQRPAKSVKPIKHFEYDPDQPLHLSREK